tara:strand:+ start:137 stop:565 length:429 start_codon:yes stop_codon:yes gene_type:complete
MFEQKIKLSKLAIDEGDDTIQFQFDFFNGINSTSIDFYGYDDQFQNFAKELCTFPKNIDSEVIYELGEQGEKWAYYILVRVFCYENNGHTAIQIKIDNNSKEPFKSFCEFYILTVPASINKLGQLIKNWNPKIDKEIEWIAE